nr:zinc-binding alcohol dehydrogenase family protein [Microlunatus panaciterrae]
MAGIGLNRVLEPIGSLPQSALRLDAESPPAADEVAIAVERLNLDAASFRQISEFCDGDPDRIRAHVLEIITSRGKMHNPVTGSGGMLIGTVEYAGPQSPLGLGAGQRVATLVSLTLTPLQVTDGLTRWDGLSEQVPCSGRAILFARSIAARLPDDLPAEQALAVFDVCGAPALTRRVVQDYQQRGGPTVVAVIGAAGKSGSLALASAADLGATTIGVVYDADELQALERAGLADRVVSCDARDPVALLSAVTAAGGPAQVTVVCVDVAGCEGGAVLSTAQGGTVIFFSMATQFAAAALGAEGLACDITMIIGNGYLPGHSDLALDLYRRTAGVRQLFARRLGH